MSVNVEKPSITIMKKVGCGNIYCTFVEHNNGKFSNMLIRGSMAKTAPCGESWLWAMASLLTFSIRRGLEEEGETIEQGIVKQLQHHTCNVGSLVTERSCASAIGKAVKEYLYAYHKKVSK